MLNSMLQPRSKDSRLWTSMRLIKRTTFYHLQIHLNHLKVSNSGNWLVMNLNFLCPVIFEADTPFFSYQSISIFPPSQIHQNDFFFLEQSSNLLIFFSLFFFISYLAIIWMQSQFHQTHRKEANSLKKKVK